MYHTHLKESLDRLKRFEHEISAADPDDRAQVLRSWKELVLEQCVEALQSTDNLQLISTIDRAAALVLSASTGGPNH